MKYLIVQNNPLRTYIQDRKRDTVHINEALIFDSKKECQTFIKDNPLRTKHMGLLFYDIIEISKQDLFIERLKG